MCVYRNEGKWDKSNVRVEDDGLLDLLRWPEQVRFVKGAEKFLRGLRNASFLIAE